MPFLTDEQKIIAFRGTKRVGFVNELGSSFCGFVFAGDFSDWFGLYQYYNIYGRKGYVNKLMHWPYNPQSISQQANRTIFADAVAAWPTLTDDQKAYWHSRAKNLRNHARNVFISDYLKTH